MDFYVLYRNVLSLRKIFLKSSFPGTIMQLLLYFEWHCGPFAHVQKFRMRGKK